MFLKLLKRGLLATIWILLLGIMMPRVFAVDYSVDEIVLEKSTPTIIHEDRLFNTIAIQADEEFDGLRVDFGRGWEEVEIHDDGFGP